VVPCRLPRRHRRLAAAEPGQDHRLGDLGDGQLASYGGGHRGEAGYPGHDLGVQAEFGALLELLLDGAPERGIAGVDAGDREVLVGRALIEGQHALHRQLGRVHDLGVFARVRQDAVVDQARRPDDDVGVFDGTCPALGEQIRRPRASPHEHHATLWLAAVTFGGGLGLLLACCGALINHSDVTLPWS